MSKLLSKNTAIVSFKDIAGKGKDKSKFILSAQYHINKLKGLNAYIKKDGRYVISNKINNKVEFLSENQVKHINNLLIGIDLIEMEIENIKNNENYGNK